MANTKNPVKAIRAKCIDCCMGQLLEVKLCTAEGCPLYPFRLGKNPFRTPMSEEERRRRSERAKQNNIVMNMKKENKK